MKIARDIVVIGAGRGGIESLQRVLAALPRSFPASVLALLHQVPDSAKTSGRMFDEMDFRVSYAVHGTLIQPGDAYVAPPASHLLIDSTGRLSLDGGPRAIRIGRPAIDMLFQSAAAAFGSRVIGVVLSGADGDGTDGLRAIKAAGRLSVVQSPADSSVPDMPIHALLGDDPDHCVLLEKVGPLLQTLVEDSDAF